MGEDLIGVYDCYREKHNLIALILLVLKVSVVFKVIFNKDRSNVSLLQIPQKTLVNLQQTLILIPLAG